MEIVAIKDMSVGNDTVGEMWQETKIFHGVDSVESVLRWAGLNKRVVLSVPENSEKEFKEQHDG